MRLEETEKEKASNDENSQLKEIRCILMTATDQADRLRIRSDYNHYTGKALHSLLIFNFKTFRSAEGSMRGR